MRARRGRSVSGRGGGMGEAATAGARRGGVDLTGAEIRGDLEGRNPPIFLPRQPAASSPLLALDIGGTLIKLVYTASCGGGDGDGAELRFAKFERRRLHECFDFVRAKGLLGCNGTRSSKENVALKNVPGAAFTHMNGQRNPVDVSPNNLFPYLLVNIGSGVSILKKGDNFVLDLIVKDICGELVCQKEFLAYVHFRNQLITFVGFSVSLGWQEAKHLPSIRSQRQMQAVFLRHEGYLGALGALMSYGDDNGENLTLEESEDIGLPASTTAASFGKVNSSKLSDYKLEDLAAALLNSFTYNIGQIAYFVANLSGLKRIFFRGAYVCGHEKTMDKISRSLKYWSKGEVQTTFLCHEGFLGTLGAFWSYENMGIDGLASHEVIREVLLGAPYTGQFPSLPVTEQQNVRSVHKHEST
ncbi:hypothetical protein HU200_005929 [Digitaria exilis]|uniref:Pantothenate kinase 1 n=1 Tax=Digitaria exilis TaxID=1010633 RepID=A0A835KW08_9POAL|nr:hypothetical protein HU200_005929 [Digitaria exilis]